MALYFFKGMRISFRPRADRGAIAEQSTGLQPNLTYRHQSLMPLTKARCLVPRFAVAALDCRYAALSVTLKK